MHKIGYRIGSPPVISGAHSKFDFVVQWKRDYGIYTRGMECEALKMCARPIMFGARARVYVHYKRSALDRFCGGAFVYTAGT